MAKAPDKGEQGTDKPGKDKPGEGEIDLGLGGILRGLGGLVEKLADLAEKGKELRESGEFQSKAGGKEVKGMYGFTVKVGLGRDGVKVEPFGTVARETTGAEAEVREVREPAVDVFEEPDHVLVVAEMPGVGTGDVKLEVHDDVLTIAAERGDKRYRKEVLLPGTFARERMQMSCANGVLEIRCGR